MTTTYDPAIHVPLRAAAGDHHPHGRISYSSVPGHPVYLVADRSDGAIKRWRTIEVYDPAARPRARYLGPGAYLRVVSRRWLEAAQQWLERT